MGRGHRHFADNATSEPGPPGIDPSETTAAADAFAPVRPTESTQENVVTRCTSFRGLRACVLAVFVVTLAGPGLADNLRIPAPKLTPDVERRIDALLERMTLADKLGQLSQQWGGETQDMNPDARQRALDDILGIVRAGLCGSFLGAHGAEYTNVLQRVAVEESKHKIPMLLGNDVIHGYRTIFPVPLGEAASWDPDLVQAGAAVAAEEARAAGTHWTFAPMIDVSRDPRWGRIVETAGEDPYLGQVMAVAHVKGFQGGDISAPDRVMACAKHYVAYGGAEGGRDYNTVDISMQTLYEVHLPPFEAAVQAGVGSLMSAFNEINGVPASGNPLTLDKILRNDWKFRGMVVSDWTSVTEMIAHGYVVDPAHAARVAITAGVDMDMCSFSYRDTLAESIKAGLVDEAVIDLATRRVLRMKFALGLFDNPYSDPDREARVTLSAKNRGVARRLAARSMVLLRNEDNTLPISTDVRRIAVVGPLADNARDPLGTWEGRGRAEDTVTALAGLKARAGSDIEITYAKGCETRGGTADGIPAAADLARAADLAIVIVGESEDMTGEGHSRSEIGLPPLQQQLVKAVHATGTPMVVVLMSGRPLTVNWEAENAAALLEAWHAGSECGNALADVLFGDVNPSGKLPVTFPRRVGQIPFHYNHKNTGRPPTEERYTSRYIDLPSSPLFPFGYGLSYTTYAYSDLQVATPRIKADGTLEVSATVRNTGQVAGEEIVQLYIRDLVGSTTRPVRELKGFQRISLAPGEEKKVRFALPADRLAFYNPQMQRVVEPGRFKVWIATSSAEGLEGEFEVVR